MGTLDKIIKENLEGEIFYDGWIKCKHVQRGLTHCKECLSVDNCWFYSLKKPKLPHHEKCHCHYETISFPTTKNCMQFVILGNLESIFLERREEMKAR